MKNIVIAAGYATRLYPLTENYPKPLLNIGQRNILERMLDDIDLLPEIDSHIIVTNHRFIPMFNDWLETTDYTKPITIIDDGSVSNETRLGAVRDLLLAIEHCCIHDDIMVLAADNILEFSFRGFIDCFNEKASSVIMCHHEPNLERLRRTGVIAVDKDMRVLEMEEKPEKRVSNWAVPPFYIYAKKDMHLIKDCLSNGCGSDAPGNLARYMVTKTVVHAWPMPAGRFDVGSIDSYNEAIRRFGK